MSALICIRIKIPIVTLVTFYCSQVPKYPYFVLYLENCTCPPVLVNLNLTKDLKDLKENITVRGQTKIPLTASVSRVTCSLPETTRYWHIIQIYDPPEPYKIKFLQVQLNKSKSSITVTRGLEKDVFLYVSYIVKGLAHNKVIGYNYGYSKVKRDPPIASIMGLSSASKGEGNITLNGSLSYNPEPVGQLNFTWLCRRTYETFSTPSYNVDLPNMRTNVSTGCFGNGPGMLNATTNVLVVDVDKMEEGQTYVFELIITSGRKTFNASHQLTIHQEVIFFIR